MCPFKIEQFFWLLIGTCVLALYSCGPEPVDDINFLVNGQNPDVELEADFNQVDVNTLHKVNKDTLITFTDQSTPEAKVTKRSWFVNGTLEQSGSQTVFEYTFTDIGQYCIRLCLNDQETDEFCILKCLMVEEAAIDTFGYDTTAIDTDFDGITDDLDQCPDEYGYEEFGGCPDASGNNGGEIEGGPNDPDEGLGENGNNQAGGKEEPVEEFFDRDDDGVLDIDDQCPDTKGSPDNNGCPPKVDTDGDGVPDDFDDCVTEPGLIERNGCPPPPITVDELDGTKTIGLRLPSADESCLKTESESITVTLRPQEHIELRSFNIIASGCGRIKVNLRGNDGVKKETIRTVTAGRNTINVADFVILLAKGENYTLTLSPLKTPDCPSPDVSLSDAKNCNLTERSSAHLKLANATAIFDIQYAYKR